jgi:endonuclease/exonuclease/phosphatase family metal-dependent hydrolase
MKKKLSVFQWLILFTNLIAAISLLLSYTAIYTDPGKMWQIAFFGLAYPFLMIINLLFVIYWAFCLKFSILFSLIPLLVGWDIHRNVFAFNKESSKAGEDSTIRIMSYNAHLFKSIETNEYDVRTKHQMLEMIEEEKPALICFQEFYSRRKGTYNIKDSLKKSLDLKNIYMERFEDSDDETLAIAIFSKYPIIHKKQIRFFDRMHANTCIYIDIKFNSDTIRIINIHLQSINFQPEDYQYLDKVTREAETDVQSSKRIGGRLKRAFISRSAQAKKVAQLIKESPYPVIVCGDFNDTPISFAYHTIVESGNLKSAFREKGSGFGITYGGAFPNFQIDHILCSPSIDVLNYKVIKKKFSDHYPIVAELRITGKPVTGN